ncbi:transmembrane sensor [Bordetella ansorpii]|uniref:Transmembrane sensor n=2 Tax=Bordetella ansorpii TaxID=288768 RepID=A0A157Q9W8_9BORD|nr:transmembrane sensor [Bordetella ansorpii]
MPLTMASYSDHEDAVSAEALERQALAWLRRLTSNEATAAELREFEQWVAASPAHRAAYRRAKAVWDAFKPSAGRVARAHPGIVANYEGAQRSRRRTRRAVLGLGAAAAASAGVAVLHPPLGLWPSLAEWGADYRTDAGEQRTLALAEGVDVTLNTRTSVRRQTAGGQLVGLNLLSGETAIDLAGGHRFTVRAGAGSSVAEASRLEVRYLYDKVCVTCLEGAVAVEHSAATRQLAAGEQTVYDDQAIGGVARIDPKVVSAWRRGLLIFDQTRLDEAIAEINRYRPGRVVLANDALRSQRVSGNFQISAPDQAIAQLQYMFHLRARSLGGVLILS